MDMTVHNDQWHLPIIMTLLTNKNVALIYSFTICENPKNTKNCASHCSLLMYWCQSKPLLNTAVY